ncbi:MAG: MerR family transcriptional regulator [Alphaproteobacteria bacterium]
MINVQTGKAGNNDNSVQGNVTSSGALNKQDKDDKAKKSKNAFRTISEVADELGVQQHVLRFWETKFSQIRPLKRGGGRRYYRPEDIIVLKRIHELLYTEGYTIKGVQKLFRTNGKQSVLDGDVVQAVQNSALEDFETESASAEKPEAAAAAAAAFNTAPQSAQENAPQSVEIVGMSEQQKQMLTDALYELHELRDIVSGVRS